MPNIRPAVTPRAWYAFFMCLALAVALAVRRLIPRPPGVDALPAWKRAALAAAAFAGGVLGAKLPFVIAGGEGWTGTAWLADGKTVVAGMAAGYLAVEAAKAVLGIRVKTGDGFALPLAAAMAVGRCGCFMNGCCAGVATGLPWGIDFGDGVPRHPTQLYEVAFHLALAGVLAVLLARRALPGQHLKVYLLAYAGFRFAVELLRPEPVWWLGLSVYQWACLALVPPLAAQAYVDARRPPAPVASSSPADGVL